MMYRARHPEYVAALRLQVAKMGQGRISQGQGFQLSGVTLVMPQMTKLANWICVTSASVKWRRRSRISHTASVTQRHWYEAVLRGRSGCLRRVTVYEIEVFCFANDWGLYAASNEQISPNRGGVTGKELDMRRHCGTDPILQCYASSNSRCCENENVSEVF